MTATARYGPSGTGPTGKDVTPMTTTPASPTGSVGIEVNKLGTTALMIPIRSMSPLICNRWTAKAKQELLDNQQGKRKVKQHKNPQRDYEESFYHTSDDGYGFPVLGFKAATVAASRYYGKNVSMVILRMGMFWDGVPSADQSQLLVPIHGEPKMREDMVRVGMTANIRYRAEFPEWTAVLSVRYVTDLLSQESVLSLIEAGGRGVGVGEWRPEKDGLNGTYQIDPTRDVMVIA